MEDLRLFEAIEDGQIRKVEEIQSANRYGIDGWSCGIGR